MSALTHTLPADKSTTTLGNSSTKLLDANPARNFLLIENTHASQDVWVNLVGGTAAANGVGCIFLKGGNVAASRVVFDITVPSGQINALATGSSTTVTVLEG